MWRHGNALSRFIVSATCGNLKRLSDMMFPPGLPQRAVPRIQFPCDLSLQRSCELACATTAASRVTEASHTILLRNLRDAMDMSRLTLRKHLPLMQAAQRVLDIVEERQRCGVEDRTADRQVLEAVLVDLHRVLSATASMSEQQIQPTCELGNGQEASAESTMEDYLKGDPWEDCEDLAMVDLFDFCAESLQASSCGKAMSMHTPPSHDDYPEIKCNAWAIPCKMKLLLPPRCSRCGPLCYCHLASKPSPRFTNLSSASTLSSLHLSSSERLSSASTLSSAQASTRCLSNASTTSSARTLAEPRLSTASTVSSARTLAESWEGELAGVEAQSRETQTLVRQVSPGAPILPSTDDQLILKYHWEKRLDKAHGRASRTSWQQMWQDKLHNTRRMREPEHHSAKLGVEDTNIRL